MEYTIRYAIRCPYPDSDLYCFVLDKQSKVSYYDSEVNARDEASKYENATVVEVKTYVYWNCFSSSDAEL